MKFYILIIFIYLKYVICFKNKFSFNRKNYFIMKDSNLPSNIWNDLSKNFKNIARNWFISRAEKKGIDWNYMVKQNKLDMNKLEYIFSYKENKNIIYPSYYTLPFHGYDNGNLNWNAALEGEAATLSMAVNYWKDIDPITTEEWLRFNITQNIKEYLKNNNLKKIDNILDVGCSVGISTEYILREFKDCKNMYGLDLSPYFISMATLRANKMNLPIKYYHCNAELTNLEKNNFDLIICNFILHEVPLEPTRNILNELKSLLKPNGVIAIIDLNPDRVQNNLIVSNFRKWAFEVTEPHIYQYYKTNMTEELFNIGLNNIYKIDNDPMNSIWIGKNK